MAEPKFYYIGEYDSRLPGHSYSFWTDGYDYFSVLEDGKPYWTDVRYGIDRNYVRLREANMDDLRPEWPEVGWWALPRLMRRELSERLGLPALSDKEILAERAMLEAEAERLRRQREEEWARELRAHREFAKVTGEISRTTGLPFEVSLAFRGELELAAEFAAHAAKIRRVNGGKPASKIVHSNQLDASAEWELRDCGIDRRKKAIIALLDSRSERLNSLLQSMGQRNSTRIANYLLSL